jgi:hypothetical protein
MSIAAAAEFNVTSLVFETLLTWGWYGFLGAVCVAVCAELVLWVRHEYSQWRDR